MRLWKRGRAAPPPPAYLDQMGDIAHTLAATLMDQGREGVAVVGKLLREYMAAVSQRTP
jgi:hypothetical protein